MADYYVCSWGEVFRVMMPAGMLSGNPARVRLERRVRFASAWRHAKAVDALRTELRGPRQIAVIESLAGYAAEGLQEPRQSDVLPAQALLLQRSEVLCSAVCSRLLRRK